MKGLPKHLKITQDNFHCSDFHARILVFLWPSHLSVKNAILQEILQSLACWNGWSLSNNPDVVSDPSLVTGEGC